MISISEDEIVLANISVGRTNKHSNKEVFLKLLISGKNCSLYKFSDNIKSRYYVRTTADSIPDELYYYMFYADNDRSELRTQNLFRDKLQLVAQSYSSLTPALKTQIETAKYEEESLKAIVARINGTSAVRDKIKFKLVAGLAANLNHAHYSGNHQLSEAKPSSSFAPKLSLGADLYSNASVGKFLFRAEVSYTSFKSSIILNKLYTYSANKFVHHYEQTLLSAVPEIIYNFYNTKKLKVYGSLGGSFNFATYRNSKFEESFDGVPTSTSTYSKTPDMLGFYLSYPVGAGLTVLNKFELFGSYQPPVGITRGLSYTVLSKTINAGLKYRLYE